jgi:glycosyltransferase involved in cell wall biosynthesis
MIHGMHVAPLAPECRMTVVLPARNEEAHIARALHALAEQPARELFDAIVFANGCTDATAAVARAFGLRHPELSLHVVEETLPAGLDHVGAARRIVMDCAAQRFVDADRPGIVATTDADTVVGIDWVARTFEEMEAADAVAGFVEIGPAERAALPPAVRALYALENEFRAAWTEVETMLDPQAADPLPRHRSFVGASFAVSVDAYVRAGRLPPLPVLEDREFVRALRRIDARIRHSLRVRAFTSGRHARGPSAPSGTERRAVFGRAPARDRRRERGPRRLASDLGRRPDQSGPDSRFGHLRIGAG